MSWSLVVTMILGAVGLVALAGFEARSAPPPMPVANLGFRSLPDPDDPAVVWAVGDGADGSDAARAVARRIAADRPARMLYLGDVYERGSASDFRRHYGDVYGRLADITAPTPGNHDWPAHPQGYDPYWRARTGAATPPWYAFRAGGWQIISLNSEAPHGPGSVQVRWLNAQLRRSAGTCVMAFWHRPLQSAGRHGDQPDVAPLWNALRGRATLVVNGHDHDLQRFRPRDGIVELVAGAGGNARYGLGRDGRLLFGGDSHDGALRLRLHPGSAALAFVSSQGTTLDESHVGCRSASDTPPRSPR